HLNTKKDHRIKQLAGTLSQHKRKRSQYISRICAAASHKSLPSSQ
ncbi:3798_t:CDS:1, partial [Cetraspora pellucida]